MASHDEVNKEKNKEATVVSQDEVNKGPMIRCSPGALHDIIKHVPDGAKNRIKEIGFEHMLKMKQLRLPCKKIVEWLMDRAKATEDGIIVLQIRDGVQLTLQPKDVYLILGVGIPRGESQKLPERNDKSSAVYQQLCDLLIYASDNYGKNVADQNKDAADVPGQPTKNQQKNKKRAADVPGQPTKKQQKNKKREYFRTGNIATLLQHRNDEEIKDKFDNEVAARLFCIEVLDKVLVPSAASSAPRTIVDAVTDLDKLKGVDWCTVVFEKLKTSIDDWKKASNDPKNRTMTGCVYLLLILFLDFIKEGKTLDDPTQIPRICQYDHHKIKQVLGQVEYDKFDFLSLEDTCYGKRDVLIAEALEKEMDLVDEDGGPYMDQDRDQLQNDLFPVQDMFPPQDRNVPRLYKKHVLARARDKIKLNILGVKVPESVYVDCFKPHGWMHSSIMYLQCELWNEEWNDKFILSQTAVYELLEPGRGTRALTHELGPENPKQANLIFIPIIHSCHWFLLVVSRMKSTIYILDSLPSKSRESKIAGIISILKEKLQQSTAGSDYSTDVLPVQKQENTSDCGFHVLLYIKEFEDTEKICRINKEMVEKCRMDTSIDLLYHRLNKPCLDTVITKSDDDEVMCLEDSSSDYNAVFNTALHKERSESPVYNADIKATGGDDNNAVFNTALHKERSESPVYNADIKATGGDDKKEGPQTQDIEAPKSQAKTGDILYHRKRLKPKPDPKPVPSDLPMTSELQDADNKEALDENESIINITKKLKLNPKPDLKLVPPEVHECTPKTPKLQVPANKEGLDENEPLRSLKKKKKLKPNQDLELRPSELVRPDCLRQLPLPELSSMPKDRIWLKNETIEEVYKRVIECEHVILKFGKISMTGSQLKRYLQGGEDAMVFMKLLIEKYLKTTSTGRTRTFLPPLDMDDQDLEKKILSKLIPRTTRGTQLSDTDRIIYCPVFVSGECIVICFVLAKMCRIHVLCHSASLDSIKSFCLRLGDKLNKDLIERGCKAQFPKKLAYTHSSIKPNDSVFASMYFLENFEGFEATSFKKFTWPDEYKDGFIRDYKLALLPFFLLHKGNTATIPAEISELMSKKRRNES